ncbi:hypothetical protein [Methylobacterium sp. V23]|uniref:hypothetical protein n=1 Tax=Methylobacterium sp. V23 TaxID=2044878 RepID=UPI0011B07F1E|nr:hypothetical protein [Methylobacterium sp. V23]
MLRSILVVSLLATAPVAVYSAATWPAEPRVDLEAREQRERFFDHLEAQQALRREKIRREFDGGDRIPLSRTR